MFKNFLLSYWVNVYILISWDSYETVTLGQFIAHTLIYWVLPIVMYCLPIIYSRPHFGLCDNNVSSVHLVLF